MSADAAVEVRDLAKHYPAFALRGVSFTLPTGYVMGVIGPNGAGKTTTLKILLGLVRRTAGDVLTLGHDPERQGRDLASKIGFVSDEPAFYPSLSLAANAGLVATTYPRWDDAAFARLAERLELPLAKRFGSCSRGNRMRFAAAVALAHHAELLILDEPTSGLDPVGRNELLDLLLEALQSEKVSVILSTHITADLERIADYITLLQDGQLVLCAPRHEIADRWALVKGELELLDQGAAVLLRGVQRGPYGFVALTEEREAVRAEFGSRAVYEAVALEDLIVHTVPGSTDA